jgi:hypothetical protein
VNWCPQAAEAADERSSKSSSRTEKLFPLLPTDGQRPPRERTNSKNVSMTTTFFTITVVVVEPEAEVV